VSLERLQAWYAARCDGAWEATYGVEIDTIDNPGWQVVIDLADTGLDLPRFPRVEIDRSEDDWLRCWMEGQRWHAACGPANLAEAVALFLAWAEDGTAAGPEP
jgi:hypothetical protein